MKKIMAYSTVALLASAMYSPAFAASTSGNASAKVVAPIAIAEATALNFGSFSVGASGGTVVITQAGAVSKTGDVELVPSTGATNAVFNVTGAPSSTYSITPPASMTVTSGANSMTVNGFSVPTTGLTLNGSGAHTFNLGATLNVGSNQAQGTYTGTYSISVNY